MNTTARVAIVGGGITGLAAAYALHRLARERGEPLRVSVLEASDRWGGKIRTERLDGFVIEAGPDTFVSTKPWGVALCRELGLESRLHGANLARGKVFVLHRGRLMALPDGLAMMVPSRIGPIIRTPLLSPLGKLRLGLDWILPARREDSDETLAGFVTRRLGRQAYERLIEPLMSGIYAGDGDRLSLLSTFPYLREWERRYGSVARGALAVGGARRRDGGGPRRSVFLTPAAGLGEIIEALVARLDGVDLRLATAVDHVERVEHGYRLTTVAGEALEAAAIIVAAPAYAASAMLGQLDPALATLLAEIEYVSTATVSLAYRESDLGGPLDGHGYIIPRREGRKALACTWTSTKFPHRAPPGRALLRVFIGRAGDTDDGNLSEAELIDTAREEVGATLGVRAEPLLARAASWPQAMPQYNLGHPERLQAIRRRLKELPGLCLAGAAYDGVGIPDCIHSGQQAAQEILAESLAGLAQGSSGRPEAGRAAERAVGASLSSR